VCHETVTFKDTRYVQVSVVICTYPLCSQVPFKILQLTGYRFVIMIVSRVWYVAPNFFSLGGFDGKYNFSFNIQVSGNSGLTAGIPTAQTAFAPVQEYAQHVIKSGSLYCRLFYNTGS